MPQYGATATGDCAAAVQPFDHILGQPPKDPSVLFFMVENLQSPSFATLKALS